MRESLLRESAPRAQTARERRELAGLAKNLGSSSLRGTTLRLRLRNFRPSAEGYLASLGGPLPYMRRLRDIERLTAAHESALADERVRLSRAEDNLSSTWQAAAQAWRFDEVTT